MGEVIDIKTKQRQKKYGTEAERMRSMKAAGYTDLDFLEAMRDSDSPPLDTSEPVHEFTWVEAILLRRKEDVLPE